MAGAGREQCDTLSGMLPHHPCSHKHTAKTCATFNLVHCTFQFTVITVLSSSILVFTHLHALDVITGSPQLCSGAWVAARYQQRFLPAPAACTGTGGQHWLWAGARQLRCCWPRALLLLLCIALAVLCWGRAGPACKHAASIWGW
jgi:hypothetical protein